MPAQTEFFTNYITNYFIETGSYRGKGIRQALEAGFPNVRSVELFRDNYDFCMEQYKDNEKVQLYFGSSTKLLPEMIKDLDEPVTFWLDAHYSGPGTAKTDGKFSPIIQELMHIKSHPIKNHIIMIDDIRDFGTRNFDFVKREEAVKVIKSINPEYKITFETASNENPLFKNDVLVAKI